MEKTESSNLKIVDDDTYKRKIIVQQNLGKQACMFENYISVSRNA